MMQCVNIVIKQSYNKLFASYIRLMSILVIRHRVIEGAECDMFTGRDVCCDLTEDWKKVNIDLSSGGKENLFSSTRFITQGCHYAIWDA